MQFPLPKTLSLLFIVLTSFYPLPEVLPPQRCLPWPPHLRITPHSCSWHPVGPLYDSCHNLEWYTSHFLVYCLWISLDLKRYLTLLTTEILWIIYPFRRTWWLGTWTLGPDYLVCNYLCLFLAPWPLTNYFTFLCLTFLNCTMGIIIDPNSQESWEKTMSS